ncbi:aquaporin-like protein [Tuber brumale]|nr:aquaporin-like protein [Tuber brumale]
MAGDKIGATARTAPIDGGDSENASLKVGLRAPLKQNIPRDYALIMCGEFLGTFLFFFLAFGATQAAKINHSGSGPSPKDPTRAVPTPELLLYLAICAGSALTVNVWVFYRVTGAFFNPALTLGCVLVGKVPPLKGALMGITQLVAGIAAAGLIKGLIPGKLAIGTNLAPNVSVVQGLFIEVFLTAQLMLAFFLHRATYIAPVGIGLCFFVTQLFGAYFTGGSLSPARSFGPALVMGDFPSYHWIYWVGPCLGAALGAGVYKFLLLVNYETLHPGQDDDGLSIVRYEVGCGGNLKFGETQGEGRVISGSRGTASTPADENV